MPQRRRPAPPACRPRTKTHAARPTLRARPPAGQAAPRPSPVPPARPQRPRAPQPAMAARVLQCPKTGNLLETPFSKVMVALAATFGLSGVCIYANK
jgi:hypothetical protein